MDARGSSWSLNSYMNSKQANGDRQTDFLAAEAEMAKSDDELEIMNHISAVSFI